MLQDEKKAYESLYKMMNSYSEISPKTWEEIQNISQYITIEKQSFLCRINDIPKSLFFISKGLARDYVIHEKGTEYNEMFFDEGSLVGSMTALLNHEPSNFEIQTLEDCQIIKIDFKSFRQLLYKSEDLKVFHIHYLEKNWLMANQSLKLSYVQDDAQQRYEIFLETYPNLEERIPQYHIASYLGITPIQLSRIRKNKNY